MGPMDVPSIRRGQLPALKVLFGLARIHPWLVSPLLMADRAMFRSNPARAVETLARLLTPPDRALLAADPGLGARFGETLAEAYAQGIRGAMHEAHLIARPRGFALEEIAVPVHLYQSGRDRNVPPAMGAYMAERIPAAQLHLYANEGHLSVLFACFADCLRDLAASAPK
jgi:pimeloyl-ACP methyl ester carboxylesterase